MTTGTDVLQRFVRGETGWEALTELGVRVEFLPEALHVEEPGDAPVYEPAPADLATGLVRHSPDPMALQVWARVLLAANMIDLVSLERHADGEALLDAIWDAAEATNIDERRLRVIRNIAAGG